MGGSALGIVLGRRLRARRESKKMSQAKLAELVELTPNYLGMLERGESLPTVQTLVVLARALDTSPAELLGSVSVPDAWLDRLIAVARTVPKEQRQLLLSVAETIATTYEPSEAKHDGSRRAKKTRKTRPR